MGGKSSGGGGSQTVNTEPWEAQQPYLRGLMKAALAGTHFGPDMSRFNNYITGHGGTLPQSMQQAVQQPMETNAQAQQSAMNSVGGTGILAQIAAANKKKAELENILFPQRHNPSSDLLSQYKDLTGTDWIAPITKRSTMPDR